MEKKVVMSTKNYDISSVMGISAERTNEIIGTVERLFTEMQINKNPSTVISYILNLKDDREKVLAAFHLGILSAAIMTMYETTKWLAFVLATDNEIDEEVKKRTGRDTDKRN